MPRPDSRLKIDPNVNHQLVFRCGRHDVELEAWDGPPFIGKDYGYGPNLTPDNWWRFDLSNMMCPSIDRELEDIDEHTVYHDNLVEEDAETWTVEIIGTVAA